MSYNDAKMSTKYLKLSDFQGNHVLKFNGAHEKVAEFGGQEFVAFDFVIEGSDNKTIGEGAEISHAVFKGKFPETYFFPVVRRVAGACLGLDPMDDEVDWDTEISKMFGKGSEHPKCGNRVLSIVNEKTNKKTGATFPEVSILAA